jgi:hypothetical protein
MIPRCVTGIQAAAETATDHRVCEKLAGLSIHFTCPGGQ